MLIVFAQVSMNANFGKFNSKILTYVASDAWNSLPIELRSVVTPRIFRRAAEKINLKINLAIAAN